MDTVENVRDGQAFTFGSLREVVMDSSGWGSYCESPWHCRRRATQEVMAGEVGIGGQNPVRVQSMTTSRGKDVDESVRQVLAIAGVGGELVRITVPTMADAEALRDVVEKVRAAGCHVAIVADIHFSPDAALSAALCVDKVRINPGNYCGAQQANSDAEYQSALLEIGARMQPLLAVCKARGVALRIGINHGSLSPRVTARYGAGPEGMVVSALEFIAICRAQQFHDVVVSLKASSPKIMVQANRLLCAQMRRLGWSYPLHLGVTEAGNALDGRVKSAIGIGALLADGIGDTIRVSLTEAPAAEIPVGKALLAEINAWPCEPLVEGWNGKLPYNPFLASKLEVNTHILLTKRDHALLVEYIDADAAKDLEGVLAEGGYARDADGRWECGEGAVDAFLLQDSAGARNVPRELAGCVAVRDAKEVDTVWRALSGEWTLREMSPSRVFSGVQEVLARPEELLLLRADRRGAHDWRMAISALREKGYGNGVVVGYSDAVRFDGDDYALRTAAAFGAVLVDNIAVGIAMPRGAGVGLAHRREVGLTILQGVELRRSKVEIVACPGCGRTLFDLQSTLERVKGAMASQRHLKIGVMGCIVNGPGEMADADYGYVGSGHGCVTLYRGREAVQKGVAEEVAIDVLKSLIKSDGRWRE